MVAGLAVKSFGGGGSGDEGAGAGDCALQRGYEVRT